MTKFDFTNISKLNEKYKKQNVLISNGAVFVALAISTAEKLKAANVLYLHVNRNNKKCYVGITVMQTADRWNLGISYRRNRRFGAAISKYGWESFESFILAFAENRDSLNQIEILAIAAAGGHKSRFTYNLSPGGDFVAENDKPIVGINLISAEERKFKSSADAARKLNMTNPDMPSAVARGERTSVAGWWFKFADDYTKELPKIWGEDFRVEKVRLKQGKKIIAINYQTFEEKKFSTISDAAKNLGVNQSQISSIASGSSEIVSAKNWWFKFETDTSEIPLVHGVKKTRLKRDKKVFATHLDTNEFREFRNCSVADFELGIYKGAAASVASGSRTSAANWWFSYDNNKKPPEAFKFALVSKARSKPVTAKNLKNNEVVSFPSAKIAGEALGIPRSSISNVISGKIKSVKGFAFYFS